MSVICYLQRAADVVCELLYTGGALIFSCPDLCCFQKGALTSSLEAIAKCGTRTITIVCVFPRKIHIPLK